MGAAGNNPPGQELIPATEVIALEQARIDNEKRGIEAAQEFIAANERNHQRQFESVDNQHKREIELRHTRHKTHKVVIYAVVVAAVLTLWFLLYNAFYGDGRQQEYGLAIIQYLAIGLAGYGVISGLAGLFKKLTKPDGE